MQFINQNTGWATVYQGSFHYSLIRTTNSGLNWSIIYSDSAKVETFQFINDTLGYGLGQAGYNLMLKTTNSGYNWTVMQYSAAYVYSGFYMINADTGWVNAFYLPTQVTLRTTNGFQTMEQISTGGGGTPATLYFFKEKYNGEYCGYVLGAGILSKTTNSGYNWQDLTFSETGSVSSFSFINKDSGWVVFGPNLGNNSKILFTPNSGQNWILQNISIIQFDFGIIQAVSKNRIWSGKGAYSRVAISTNCGISWGYQNSPIINNHEIYFYDTLLGFAWNNNQIVRTINGGGPITQISNIEKQITNSCKLYQNYPNPFNSSTNIEFQIPKSSLVKLVIYDILGREKEILVNEKISPGIYKANFTGENLSSGIYIYSLFADGIRVDTKKLVVIK